MPLDTQVAQPSMALKQAESLEDSRKRTEGKPGVGGKLGAKGAGALIGGKGPETPV